MKQSKDGMTAKDKSKRPLIKSDFETFLKAASKPLKKEQGEPKSAKT